MLTEPSHPSKLRKALAQPSQVTLNPDECYLLLSPGLSRPWQILKTKIDWPCGATQPLYFHKDFPESDSQSQEWGSLKASKSYPDSLHNGPGKQLSNFYLNTPRGGQFTTPMQPFPSDQL